MTKTIKKIVGLVEAFMLLLTGGFTLWLSLSDEYLLLMNENFRWLTLIGSCLLLILGIVAVRKPAKSSLTNSIFFLFMLIIVLVGKPYLPHANAIGSTDSYMQAGLWEQIDLEKFPKMELRNLSTSEDDKVYENSSSFTTVGIVKRLEGLDEYSSFAFMSTFMYCCVADMFGTGFRVPTENLTDLEDGQMVMISGKLLQEDKKIELPNFKIGMATISSVNQDYYLEAEKIMTFNRNDQLPRLKEMLLKGERTQLFANALQKSGLMEDLEKSGAYTLFVPVDKALENLETPLDEMSSRKLRRFLKTHIIKEKVYGKELHGHEKLKTLNGKILKAESINGKLIINESRVLFKDTEAQNGVIHFIYPAITNQ